MKNLKKKIIAIIPARAGSKGIPKKNIVDFCGKPLITWTIRQALKSRYLGDVYVSSDGIEILNISARAGAKTIRRPKSLSGDRTSSEAVLIHALSHIEKVTGRVDYVVFLQATSPLREGNDIDAAIAKFIKTGSDSLFSASLLEDFCAWERRGGQFKSLTFNYKKRGRRQEKKPYYLENGSIYIFSPKVLKKYKNRLGGKIGVYFMPMWKSHEIDSREDIPLCAFYMKNKILK